MEAVTSPCWCPTHREALRNEIFATSRYAGAATFAVTLSPDGETLYAVNAGSNSIAVIPLRGPAAHRVVGLIPTAYEPHDITLSADGTWLLHGLE